MWGFLQENIMKSKTILIGNGINYLGGNVISWKDLLITLMEGQIFDTDELPNLMAYEKIRLNWTNQYNEIDSSSLKKKIADLLGKHEGNETCKKILQSGFTNYITTNYDHAIENTFLLMNQEENSTLNSEKESGISEKNYSIRRCTKLIKKGSIVGNVWHIHGDSNQPNSIMLGFNHYVGYVAKVDSYLKGKYNSSSNHDVNLKPILSIDKKIEHNDFDQRSWIELFFNTDVHIVGFGFDFYEIDLWNILTKRARLHSQSDINNKIFYYTKPIAQVDENKRSLESNKRDMLTSLGVIVKDVELHKKECGNYDYEQQWHKFIKIMQKN